MRPIQPRLEVHTGVARDWGIGATEAVLATSPHALPFFCSNLTRRITATSRLSLRVNQNASKGLSIRGQLKTNSLIQSLNVLRNVFYIHPSILRILMIKQ